METETFLSDIRVIFVLKHWLVLVTTVQKQSSNFNFVTMKIGRPFSVQIRSEGEEWEKRSMMAAEAPTLFLVKTKEISEVFDFVAVWCESDAMLKCLFLVFIIKDPRIVQFTDHLCCVCLLSLDARVWIRPFNSDFIKFNVERMERYW